MLISISDRATSVATCMALALTACTHDAVAPMASSVTPEQAVAAGTRLSREIGTSLSALTVGGTGGVTGAYIGGSGRVLRAASAPPAGPCPKVSNPADPDHDGIPDSATLTFSLPQCESITGGDTTEVTGVVYLSDPVSSSMPAGAVGYTAAFSDFTVHFGARDPDSSATETRNGAELFVFAPSAIVTTYGFRIAHQDESGLANVVDRWNATFAPAAGTNIVPGLPLPAGLFAAQGQTTWQRGSAAAQFTIVTATPLAYDPSCPESDPNRFLSGEVHAQLLSPGQQAYVRIVFADCAPPSVTYVVSGAGTAGE